MPYSFRIRLIPLLVTIVLCVLGLSLGQWQSRRALEKDEIASAMRQRGQMPPLESTEIVASSKDIVYRKLVLSGSFVREWVLYLDNRPLHGVAGFYVLMPFKIQGSAQHVMVVRGWQPRNPANRLQMSALTTPEGIIKLEGVARHGVDRVMQLGQPEAISPGVIVQNLVVADAAKQTGLRMFDFVLEQTSDSSDGLQRDWPMPSAGADKHRAYAFQWYALSLMAVIFFVVTGFRRGKNR
ncbi:MAG: SURF1 family protein [Undibacterium sp.]|uniref:SURF1 family protein n=1 Tax=Undibacterium sp. TaxID=1914977 RepID=UPI002727E35B|nr:SURF1 family protein [Undibacterium sp.]MDO8652560.1 SURF1 family protein [Undibacterium sp.]